MNKPGYKTTEFWFSLLTMVSGVLVATGYIAPEDGQRINELMQTQGLDVILRIIGGTLMAVLSVYSYNASRATVKQINETTVVNKEVETVSPSKDLPVYPR